MVSNFKIESMKIFSLKNQILAGVITSAHGNSEPRYTTAVDGHNWSFERYPGLFWREDFLKDAVQARYPKFWRKWIDRKSAQFSKLAELVKRPFERCGTKKG